MADDSSINEESFDALIEAIVADANEVVIDNGAANYHPFMSYMLGNDVPGALAANGRELIIHVPIVGGAARNEALNGLDDICMHLPEVPVVVWLNEAAQGDIREPDGTGFEDFKVYKKHKAIIMGMIKVPRRSGSLFLNDMQKLLKNEMTFDQGIGR